LPPLLKLRPKYPKYARVVIVKQEETEEEKKERERIQRLARKWDRHRRDEELAKAREGRVHVAAWRAVSRAMAQALTHVATETGFVAEALVQDAMADALAHLVDEPSRKRSLFECWCSESNGVQTDPVVLSPGVIFFPQLLHPASYARYDWNEEKGKWVDSETGDARMEIRRRNWFVLDIQAPTKWSERNPVIGHAILKLRYALPRMNDPRAFYSFSVLLPERGVWVDSETSETGEARVEGRRSVSPCFAAWLLLERK